MKSDMNIGLYQAVSGMKANQQYQDLISSNLATQGIAGNRGSIATFSVNLPDKSKMTSEDLRIAKDHPFVKMNTAMNVAQGPMRETSNVYNLAIAGEGFFSVQEPDGRVTLTRNGQFTRSADDELITLDGGKVLMEGNQPLRFSSKSDPIISQGGQVKMDGQNIGRLALVKVNNPQTDLVLSTSGRYIANGPTTEIDQFSAQDRIMQGYVEDSNINPVEQMVNMMQVTRAFEAGQKAVDAHDKATGQLIQAAGPR
jgi:flagellar basal body rod protein FlgG